jgi:DNA topoisomerase-1
VLNGRYGPYIRSGKTNYKIPKDVDPHTLDRAACEEIMKNQPKKRATKKKKK